MASHIKTAVLVNLVDDEATSVLQTPFGEQTLQGSFYVVAEGDESYGAARAQFEMTHEQVGPERWRKTEPVLAYQVDDACTVETHIAHQRETSVVAQPGDWIVQQDTGEIMVLTADAFATRYAISRRGNPQLRPEPDVTPDRNST